MTYKVVVFDWDGTLVDSEAHIVSCIGYAAEQLGLPSLSYDKRKNIIGLGMREALLALYPELDEGAIVKMREHYSTHFFMHSTSAQDLFPGVWDTLETLKRAGVRLAVATGKSRNGLSKALISSGLGGFFDIERCADETASKPNPQMLQEISSFYRRDPSEMLMVGDTTYDMEMASRFGMPSVGVSYGVHQVQDLVAHGPVKVINALPELLAVL